MTMENTISKKIFVKATVAKPLGKPPPRGKTLWLDPEICFYVIEDSDETEEGEESEILAINNSSLAECKQNLVNSKFPYIDTFDHELPTVVSAICDLTVGVFDHIEITSPMDVD